MHLRVFLNRKDKIKLARIISKSAHKYQFDKAGEEYYLHPLIVSFRCETEDEKIVALLHDVVEDCADKGYTLKMLSKYFNQDIIDALFAITKQPNETRNQYLNRVVKNPIAKNVKLQDLIHNSDVSRIKNPTDIDFERSKRYRKEIDFILTCK